MLGTRHTFNDLADTDGTLIATDRLPLEVDAGSAPGAVRLSGGIRYGDLAPRLQERGLALANLASLPHISVAGAIATGTHGSGRHSLSHYLDEVRIAGYDQSGEPVIKTIDAGDELRAARCSLGCLGIVVSVAFRCRPQYRIEEHFREYATLDEVLAQVEEMEQSGQATPDAAAISAEEPDPEADDEVVAAAAEHPEVTTAGGPADTPTTMTAEEAIARLKTMSR